MKDLRVVIGVCVLAGLLQGIVGEPASWNRIDTGEAKPAPRELFAFGYESAGNRLIVFGGYTDDGVVNDTWIFDFATRNWTEVNSDTAPSPRAEPYHGVLRVAGESLFVMAFGFAESEFDDVWVFSFSTMEWTSITPEGKSPGARYGGHFGAVYGDTDTLWVGSGFTGTTPLDTRYIDTYKLIFTSATAARWEEVYAQPSIGNQFMPLSPHGRCLQASAVIEEGLVMAGGCMRGGTGGGPCPTDDTWFFNDTTNSWVELNRCITPRVWSKMAPLTNNPGKIVLYAGNAMWAKQVVLPSTLQYPEDEIFIVDVYEAKWTRHTINSSEYPERRAGFGMAAGPNGVIYVFSGLSTINDTYLDDLWELSGDISAAEEVACNNVWFSFAHLHGILMFLAFGLLFPLGVTVAQLLRCKKSKAWFIVHVTCQISAVLLSITGFIMIFSVAEGVGKVPTHPHAIIGILLMAFMFIQPINGIFHPRIKDGVKSKYRVCWEWFHRIYGSFIVLLGFTQVTLGVFLIVPPLPVWVIWLLILATWALVFIIGNTARIIYCCFCKRENEANEKNDHEMK